MQKFFVHMRGHSHSYNRYLVILVLNISMLFLLRGFETISIAINYSGNEGLVLRQVLGFFMDVFFSTSILLLLFPIFHLIAVKASPRVAQWLFVFLLIVLTVAHYLIISYFLYQLIPLDIFLFKYPLSEIVFTVATSGVSILGHILTILGLAVFLVGGFVFLRRWSVPKTFLSLSKLLVLTSVLVSAVFLGTGLKLNNYSSNKALFFYSRTLNHFSNTLFSQSFHNDALKAYTNNKYPLLRDFESNNELKPFFGQFDRSPNVVIIIVEGLNDDYINGYKGVELMPFLTQLKEESLYWSRCFTLGERSFAAVPTIVGGLPYGKRGFTMLNRLPRHLSLVSVLETNGYHTSFFYGQGAWFHRKHNFFRHNNINLIVDKDVFDPKYEKIVVGDFFWGYNDKDLFNQAHSVIDTLSNNKRLEIYFTGTAHSPFEIIDYDYYQAKYDSLLNLTDIDSRSLLKARDKYGKTVLFTDDALKDFFEIYRNRPEYENTIFVITGDHPMRELPVENSLKRYHVPLIIYSPKLIEGKEFTNVVSHLDIYDPLLALLSDYRVDAPKHTASLGGSLIGEPFDMQRSFVFMNDNRQLVDYFSHGYYLSQGSLYKVDREFSISPVSNRKMKKTLQAELDSFKLLNYYVSVMDGIIPDSLYCQALGMELLYHEKQGSGVTTSFNLTYHTFVERMPVSNEPFYFDVTFDYPVRPIDGITLVYQLSTEADSVVYWKNLGFSREKSIFQTHIKVPKQNVDDTVLYFKSFIWNKPNQQFMYSNRKVSIYQ